MRWWIFAAAVYVVLAIQVGLAPALSIATPLGEVQPRFVLLLAVLIGLSAPPSAALVACLVLGTLLDLVTPWTVALDGAEATELTLIGPYALGYLAGGYALLQLRTMVFRRQPLTIGTMVLLSGFAVQLIVVAVLSIRGWYEPIVGWLAPPGAAAGSGMRQLALRVLALLYTAVIGVALALPLTRLGPALGIDTRSRR